jgi:hypothetical protein
MIGASREETLTMTTRNVWLICLGSLEGEGSRYLDGRTQTIPPSVGLAPNDFPPFSGTQWEQNFVGDVCTFRCLGSETTEDLYLDGHTADRTVWLAPSTRAPFTGTHWRATELAVGDWTFECLGKLDNPDHLFLDGHTLDATVGLAPSTDPPYTGTHWRLEVGLD